MEPNEKVQEAVKTILNELNGGNRRKIAESIVEVLRREHRTLQQAFWCSILIAQIDYADFDSDLRNEAAVKLAKGVKKAAQELNLDYGLPMY